jgi:hypothetical protein
MKNPGQEAPAAKPAGNLPGWPRARFGLLPHEVFFGLFLIVTWVRLIFAEGLLSGDALLYLGLMAANVWACWFYRSQDTPVRCRVGLLFYPIAMNIIFAHMKSAVPKIHPQRMDRWLEQIDARLVGVNLSLRLQPLVHPVFTELLSLCYFLFFLYLLFSLGYYFLGEAALLKKFVLGLFTIYGIGFLGYSFVPAAGPCHAMAGQFSVPLDGWWFTRLNAAVVSRGSNGVDVFPSLHCAISCFLLFFDRRHRPWRFKLYVAPCVGLWVSTLYLRYHYAIDVVCGFALAGFALWLSNGRPSARPVQTNRDL